MTIISFCFKKWLSQNVDDSNLLSTTHCLVYKEVYWKEEFTVLDKLQTGRVLIKMKLQTVAFLFFVAFVAYVNCYDEYEPQPQHPEAGGGFGASFQKMGSAVGKTAVSNLEKILEIMFFF